MKTLFRGLRHGDMAGVDGSNVPPNRARRSGDDAVPVRFMRGVGLNISSRAARVSFSCSDSDSESGESGERSSVLKFELSRDPGFQSARPVWGFVERIGHRANKFDNAFAGSRRNRVKFQAALGSERAQFFKMVAVGSSVQLGGHDESSAFPPASGLNEASSCMMISKSRTGSRSFASLVSTRCAIRRVRSKCFRKRVPRPTPSCAPSIRPGRSATTKERPCARRCVGIGGNDAQMRLKRGKRIRGDFRTRG